MTDRPLAHAPSSPPLLMASLLTADLSRLGEECRALAAAGIDGIHWDIMDGVAVPALSFGPDVVLACRKATDLPFEAHVMSRVPEGMIAPLARAGCVSLTIHPDWVEHPRRTLHRIADVGMVPGVALSPGTPVEQAEWHLDVAGLVLVMSVEPGFGGQSHIPSMARKVERISSLLARHGLPAAIEVDGGIDATTIAPMSGAGAGRFVVGSAIWRAPRYADAIAAIRRGLRVAAPATPHVVPH
jgi:ribulose-phosphate 3-epimerase